VPGKLLGDLAILFFASELTLAIVKRARHAKGAKRDDRGSGAVLWVLISAAVTAAFSIASYGPGRLPFPPSAIRAVALTVLVLGLIVRWWAVITLGKFFTVDVATHADHTLIDSGPFRFVRHPSYTGLILAFLGVGISLGSGLSLLALMPPIVIALAYRMRVEEAALLRTLGPSYAAYCARTKRLIPGLI